MNKSLIAAVIAAFAVPTHAADITLIWEPVTTDEQGNTLDPSVIKYRLYNKGNQIAEADTSPHVISNAAEGCYVFTATAFRTDEQLESKPSNAVEKCVEADDQIILKMPSAPLNFRGQVTVPN